MPPMNQPREEVVRHEPQTPVRPVDQGEDLVTPDNRPEPRDPNMTRGEGTSAVANVPVNANAVVDGPSPGGALQYTSIKDHPPEKSPFTETRTVVHEFTGYLSLNQISKTMKLVEGENSVEQAFYVNLNNPYFIVEATFVGQATNATPTFGPSVTMSKESLTASNPGTANMNVRDNFPRRFVGTTNVGTDNESGYTQANWGTWTRWFQKQYRYYHVMETNYKITFEYANVNSAGTAEATAKRNVYVCYYPESYVQDNQSDIVPNQILSVSPTGTEVVKMIGLHQLKKFKGVKIQEVQNPKNVSMESKNGTTVTGTWKPGMREGSVRNIQDIKQWYPVGAKPSPTWAERMKFVAISAADSVNWGSLNVKIEVSSKVQYKDLKEDIKYCAAPTHIDRALKLRAGIDDIQYPYPFENHLAAPYNPANGAW